MESLWWVYILECSDGSLYTGVTTNLDARMTAHAEGKGSKYVYRKGFKRLLYTKKCLSRSEAQKEEARIKALPRNKKVELFN